MHGHNRRFMANVPHYLQQDYEWGEEPVVDVSTGHARFMFTPMLDGCYVGWVNDRVCHVAGKNSAGRDRPRNTLAQLAQNALGAPLTMAFDSNHADCPQMTLVGAADMNGVWSWYVQGHDLWWTFNNYVSALVDVFDTTNAAAKGTDIGSPVIQVTDLHYA